MRYVYHEQMYGADDIISRPKLEIAAVDKLDKLN